MDLSSLATHVFTFIAGLGAGWTVRIAYSNRFTDSSRTTKVKQSGNFVGGDMVAGDMHKNKDNP